MKGQEIKHRINGAKETVKITKAMQLVSASRMAKSERILIKSGEFLSSMFEIVKKIGVSTSPLCKIRSVKNTAIVVIAGDKGLCGDYNHNILEFAEKEIAQCENPVVFTVGQNVREYFNKKKIHVNNRFLHFMQGALSEEVRDMAYSLADDFIDGKYDEIFLVYTLLKKKNPANQIPCKVRLFPLELPKQYTEEGILEYPKDEDAILKQYVWAYVNFALRSAECAFNYKSMTAMMSATKNGEELVATLSQKYNRIRQERITSELMDASSSQIDGK